MFLKRIIAENDICDISDNFTSLSMANSSKIGVNGGWLLFAGELAY